MNSAALPNVCSPRPAAAHGGGAEPAVRRRGDGRGRPRGEPQAAAEGHRGGGDPARIHPVQPRQPLPLWEDLRRPGGFGSELSPGSP